MEDITVFIVSTSWILFAISALYFGYNAYCKNVAQRSYESFMKNAVELLDLYFKMFVVKEVPFCNEKKPRDPGEKRQEARG